MDIASQAKVAPGSLLLFNICHGMMSNVESSFYLFDVSQTNNSITKGAVVDYILECMLIKPQDTYKNYPLILFSFKSV